MNTDYSTRWRIVTVPTIGQLQSCNMEKKTKDSCDVVKYIEHDVVEVKVETGMYVLV